MWCPKLGKTLPKEQESGVDTAQPAGSSRSAQSAWSAVCVLS